MSYTEIPRRFRFACDCVGCEVTIDLGGVPWESTPEGWLSMRIINPEGGVPAVPRDTSRLLCPKHAAAFAEAIAPLNIKGWT